jgi:hypothetical protein
MSHRPCQPEASLGDLLKDRVSFGSLFFSMYMLGALLPSTVTVEDTGLMCMSVYHLSYMHETYSAFPR